MREPLAESITTLAGAADQPDSEAAPEGKAGRARTLIIAAGAVLLLGVGASIAYVTGALDGVLRTEPAPDAAAEAAASRRRSSSTSFPTWSSRSTPTSGSRPSSR